MRRNGGRRPMRSAQSHTSSTNGSGNGVRSSLEPTTQRSPAGLEPRAAAEKVITEPWRSHRPATARPLRTVADVAMIPRVRPPRTSTAEIVRALSGMPDAGAGSGSSASLPPMIEPAAEPAREASAHEPIVEPNAGPVAPPAPVYVDPPAPIIFPVRTAPVEALPVATPAAMRVERPAPPISAVPEGLRSASNDDELDDDEPVLTDELVTNPVPASDVAASHAPRPPRARPRPIDLPPLDLLASMSEVVDLEPAESLAETGELIEQRLREFKVPVSVVGASAGPVITRYEVEPAVGVRGNQIVALMKDLARGLGRTSIRVVETIPGKTCMGLELPNEKRQMIGLADIFRSEAYRHHDSPLALAMGKDITGEPVVTDLARAPHMLVAGTTGSGKSVAINAMILSLLYRATPEEVRMIMIDPKMLELSVYEGIPHLLAPVVTDMKLAANALNWCVAEMENRYRLMSELRVRNLAGYNQKIREAREAGTPLSNPFPSHVETPELLDTLPLIVVLIDELADLMMVAGKKIEELIARLAQKARAAGIHLILATQRPSVDVITGLIKANIPTRVAFQVSSKIDSRTILDQMGAESLLGQGDMLFLPPGTGYPQRVHGAFVADEEVHRVVAHLKQYGAPDYLEEILAGPPSEAADLFPEEAADAELDPLYDEAVAFVLRSRRASISFVQRQFRIGYNRAARLVESMEAAGLVSSMGSNGVREVLAPGPSDGM